MRLRILTGVVPLLLSLALAQAADLDKLKVLYLGEPGSPRAKQFEGFLAMNVGAVKVVSRHSFKSSDAEGMDVVLLDWPQSEKGLDEKRSQNPLGERATWSKPTVLLGSAGLRLAVAWKARGGSG